MNLLPLAPLEARLAVACAKLEVGVSSFLGPTMARALARGREAGGLTPNQADALAVKLGVHPCAIWPDSWWAA